MDRQLTELSMQMRAGEDVGGNLQQKVNDLEKRLIERDNVECSALQHKVMQLEKTLKERTHEFEIQSASHQKRVKELEEQLEKQGGSIGGVSTSSEAQIQELEEELSEKIRAGPKETKASSTDSDMKANSRTQGLKSHNRVTGQNSVLLKGSESLSHLPMKRDYQNRGIENNRICLSATASLSTEKKVSLETEQNKRRHIDPSKAFARVTRTAKPFSGLQRSFSSRISRGPAPMIKDRDTSTKVWWR